MKGEGGGEMEERKEGDEGSRERMKWNRDLLPNNSNGKNTINLEIQCSKIHLLRVRVPNLAALRRACPLALPRPRSAAQAAQFFPPS